MKIKVPQSQARLFGRAGESVTRSDRRQREQEFESPLPPLTARPNRRREDALGLRVESSPLAGAPNEHKNRGETLSPVGPLHGSLKASLRSEHPNGVRCGVEQVH
jgi:hypothetical protein